MTETNVQPIPSNSQHHDTSEEGQREVCRMAGRAGSSHHQQKNRAFPTGNALLYISLLSVAFLAGCVRVGAPCFCGYFYHHINLRCRCHSNRQRKVTLIKCSTVGYC